MKPAISVRGLSKRYRLGQGLRSEYGTLRETITSAAMAPFRRRRKAARPQATDFWAVKDVSFDVQPGEVIGVVGRNGAGKSTLLKLLSRIVGPTEGEIVLRGRVGSLLEVGTGFHPELSGRENIYLNGAILGMSRTEIQKKFDEIVAFSELEKFLDTPVKRYSSGMYTKLAFAVASHLEPEILIVDEVLAVGDAQFQKKCLGKMGEVSRNGRTVLFVSHNMTAVKALCSRAVMIEGGVVVANGEVDDVVMRYMTHGISYESDGNIPTTASRQRDVVDEAVFRSVRVTDCSEEPMQKVYFKQPFRVTAVCEILKDISDGHFEISLSTTDGVQVTYSTTADNGRGPMQISRGRHEISAQFDCALLPRTYSISLGVHHKDGTTADFVENAAQVEVLRLASGHDGHYPWSKTRGLIQISTQWKINQLD